MRLIDLTYVATRLRGDETGGAEVDVIFDSSRLMFSRWQVQCKNAERVSLDAVAKEVGLTYMLKSNAIVIITTGEVGSEARRYANRVMKDTNLCIIMIESGDIRKISLNPTEIVNVLNREAQHAMDIKKIEV
jgi:site-specific DNA-methyltransferase (cytosine-N4-specific)